MKQLLYGVAYYDEYMPYDRLLEDVSLMKQAGINVVRIAESTWSTLEPQSGVYDFRSIDRVLQVMGDHEISVIIGTPTYAVPTWLVKAYPEVLAKTKAGQNQYGPRQNMDITNPDYLYHCERVIRKLMDHVKDHPAVIGYQTDNETKHYGISSQSVLEGFKAYMQDRYPSLEAMNHALGLDYWSNRINDWDDFPNVDETINAGLSGAFETYRRQLVTDFLQWQVDLVRAYKREDQFVTQNFDFDWRGYSYGLQPDVDHFQASKAFDVVGVDIYHPTQKHLTGCEISFCGDVARSLKQDNYYVIETQAQGHAQWLPYPGQLRLQAFSHLASGANMVPYWHYHSTHNAFETYWRGLLCQDFEPNPTYLEATTIGQDFSRLSPHLVDLKVQNRVALLASNESLSGLNWFHMYMGMDYNTILRHMYDALYKMNVGCDVIGPETQDLSAYDMVVVPPLYVASDALLKGLNQYVAEGGHVVYGIRSGYSDLDVKVRSGHQPGIIHEACGNYYCQFTEVDDSILKSDVLDLGQADKVISHWIELIEPRGAQVLASYDHPHWGQYAAVTHHSYGQGSATYIGCCPTEGGYRQILTYALKAAGLWSIDQSLSFPVIHKEGRNSLGHTIHYIMNYSDQEENVVYPYDKGQDLLSDKTVVTGQVIKLKPWDVHIYEVRQ